MTLAQHGKFCRQCSASIGNRKAFVAPRHNSRRRLRRTEASGLQMSDIEQPMAVAPGDPSETLLEQLDTLDQQQFELQSEFPFKQLSTPVYSLSTKSCAASSDGAPSMNIVTYVSPMSISPRTFAVGLYRKTTTWENFLDTRMCVLQILREKHLPLVELLGHNSGKDVDKIATIQEMGFGIAQFFGQNVLADCYGLVELEIMSGPVTVGDHDVVICSAGAFMTNRADANDVLTTTHLREAGLCKAETGP